MIPKLNHQQLRINLQDLLLIHHDHLVFLIQEYQEPLLLVKLLDMMHQELDQLAVQELIKVD